MSTEIKEYIVNGDLDQVRIWVEDGTRKTTWLELKAEQNPLLLAAACGQFSILKWLVEEASQKAELSASSKRIRDSFRFWQAPALRALYAHHYEIVKWLLLYPKCHDLTPEEFMSGISSPNPEQLDFLIWFDEHMEPEKYDYLQRINYVIGSSCSLEVVKWWLTKIDQQIEITVSLLASSMFGSTPEASFAKVRWLVEESGHTINWDDSDEWYSSRKGSFPNEVQEYLTEAEKRPKEIGIEVWHEGMKSKRKTAEAAARNQEKRRL